MLKKVSKSFNICLFSVMFSFFSINVSELKFLGLAIY